MKANFSVILFLLTAVIGTAATLTVDIPANDVPRVSEAFGVIYGLGHNASVQEVAFYTRLWIIESTKAYERGKYTRTFVELPLEMQPSPTPGTTATPTATP
jgi:hypothetical protein